MKKGLIFRRLPAVALAAIAASTFAVLYAFLPSLAQSAGPRTVGDGTAFVFSPGRSEGYGVNSGDIGGQVGTPLYSRHHRLGEDTGIGSSTLQTTSTTSESTPATVSSFIPAATQFSLARPNLLSPFQAGYVNPALTGYTVSPSDGIFSGNGLTSPYSEMGGIFSGQVGQPAGLYQDLDAVPSFSRRGSRSVLPLSGEGNDQLFKKVEPQF